MSALYPCASITGAPKVRTMAIIAGLESEPRGVYTGTIGYFGPGRQAHFNVAIRTVTIDKRLGQAEYGVGGGIVWDSDAAGEYAECRAKARILTERRPAFSLLESLRWTPETGYFLLDEHLRRLAESAEYFGNKFHRAAVCRALDELAAGLPGGSHKVRLLLSAAGEASATAAPLVEAGGAVRLALAARPVDRRDVFLYHKTTQRAVYEQALEERPSADDVILWNERRELTETATANLVFKRDGEWLTPPVEAGLLAGTYRGRLLAAGVIREVTVRCEDLEAVEEIAVINSVRGWRPARLIG
jgi:para-aminobenzoate synthetase/4-amino-4-deoxychorismate lyase